MARRKKRKDPLERAKDAGEILRIRTIKPTPDTYMHIGIRKKKGKRGGTTVSGPLRHVKKRKTWTCL